MVVTSGKSRERGDYVCFGKCPCRSQFFLSAPPWPWAWDVGAGVAYLGNISYLIETVAHTQLPYEIWQHSKMAWFGYTWGRIYQIPAPLLFCSHFPLRLTRHRANQGEQLKDWLIAFHYLDCHQRVSGATCIGYAVLSWFPIESYRTFNDNSFLGLFICPAVWNLYKARVQFHLSWNRFEWIALFSLQYQEPLFCLPLYFPFF